MGTKPTHPTIDIYKFQRTGNLSVDMVVACIQSNFVRQKPLKAIILSNAYYNIFKKWVIDNWGEEYAYAEFAIEGVTIRQEAIISGKSLLEEYYKSEEIN